MSHNEAKKIYRATDYENKSNSSNKELIQYETPFHKVLVGLHIHVQANLAKQKKANSALAPFPVNRSGIGS